MAASSARMAAASSSSLGGCARVLPALLPALLPKLPPKALPARPRPAEEARISATSLRSTCRSTDTRVPVLINQIIIVNALYHDHCHPVPEPYRPRWSTHPLGVVPHTLRVLIQQRTLAPHYPTSYYSYYCCYLLFCLLFLLLFHYSNYYSTYWSQCYCSYLRVLDQHVAGPREQLRRGVAAGQNEVDDHVAEVAGGWSGGSSRSSSRII